MYRNEGIVSGVLASRPMKINDSIVLIRIKVVERNIDKKTGKREVNIISAYAYGSRAEKIFKGNLEQYQEIEIRYKVKTNTKEIKGEEKTFEDKVIVDVIFGRKSDRKPFVKKPESIETIEEVEDFEERKDVEIETPIEKDTPTITDTPEETVVTEEKVPKKRQNKNTSKLEKYLK